MGDGAGVGGGDFVGLDIFGWDIPLIPCKENLDKVE